MAIHFKLNLRSYSVLSIHKIKIKSMGKFQIKEYKFGELARLYYPDRLAHTAVRLFREELKQTVRLSQMLKSTGYKGTERILSRNQVRIIVECIGTP